VKAIRVIADRYLLASQRLGSIVTAVSASSCVCYRAGSPRVNGPFARRSPNHSFRVGRGIPQPCPTWSSTNILRIESSEPPRRAFRLPANHLANL